MSDRPQVIAKQSLGQNFLIDPNLAAKIVRALPDDPTQTVLEIGPGTGALTDILVEAGRRVIAVEIDQRLIPLLHERFGDRVEVIHADVLDVDLTKLAAETPGRLAVLGNLPYYASSPILFHLLAHRRALGPAVLTLQDEVVRRCCAGPGTKDYGSVSVWLALFASPRRLFALPSQVFRPRPKVASAAFGLDFANPVATLPQDEAHFEKVLRAAFGQRRKTLRNSLSGKLGTALTDAILDATRIDGKRRAEQLAPGEFVALADAFTEAGGS